MNVSHWLEADFVKRVIREDVGRGDLFAMIGDSHPIKAYVVAKSEGIFAGRKYLEIVENLFGIHFGWRISDGEAFGKNQRLFEISGNSGDILSLERSILDMALHASGIATQTAEYVRKLEKYDCILLDTRKTRPGLRMFEKYAVRCGGGRNHRMGLDDCLMLKDTHLRAIDDLGTFISEMRSRIPFTTKIEVECESMEMVEKAMMAGADIVMCDNMEPDEIRKAVRFRNTHYPHVLMEASGNVTLGSIEAIAASGVDAISSGSIVHQATWPDFSMRVEG